MTLAYLEFCIQISSTSVLSNMKSTDFKGTLADLKCLNVKFTVFLQLHLHFHMLLSSLHINYVI